MTTLTVSIPEEQLAKLSELAAELNVTPEALVAARVEELVRGPDEEFERIAAYVLKKNADLYRRLA